MRKCLPDICSYELFARHKWFLKLNINFTFNFRVAPFWLRLVLKAIFNAQQFWIRVWILFIVYLERLFARHVVSVLDANYGFSALDTFLYNQPALRVKSNGGYHLCHARTWNILFWSVLFASLCYYKGDLNARKPTWCILNGRWLERT